MKLSQLFESTEHNPYEEAHRNGELMIDLGEVPEIMLSGAGISHFDWNKLTDYLSQLGDIEDAYSHRANDWKTKRVDIVLQECQQLESVDYGNANIRYLTIRDCNSYKKIQIPTCTQVVIQRMDHLDIVCEGVTIPEEYFAFQNCKIDSLKVNNCIGVCQTISIIGSHIDKIQITNCNIEQLQIQSESKIAYNDANRIECDVLSLETDIPDDICIDFRNAPTQYKFNEIDFFRSTVISSNWSKILMIPTLSKVIFFANAMWPNWMTVPSSVSNMNSFRLIFEDILKRTMQIEGGRKRVMFMSAEFEKYPELNRML